MGRIVFCVTGNKYYRKIYTDVYRKMEKHGKQLERARYYATLSNDARRIKNVTNALELTRRKRYKGVIFEEIPPDAVPENVKSITSKRPPDGKKHQVIYLKVNS